MKETQRTWDNRQRNFPQPHGTMVSCSHCAVARSHRGLSTLKSLPASLCAWLPAAPRAPYTQIACTTEHSTMLVNARLCSLIFGDLNLHSYFSTVSCNGISTESRAKHETSSPLETLEASDHICSATGNPVALRTPLQTSAGRVQQGQT